MGKTHWEIGWKGFVGMRWHLAVLVEMGDLLEWISIGWNEVALELVDAPLERVIRVIKRSQIGVDWSCGIGLKSIGWSEVGVASMMALKPFHKTPNSGTSGLTMISHFTALTPCLLLLSFKTSIDANWNGRNQFCPLLIPLRTSKRSKKTKRMKRTRRRTKQSPALFTTQEGKVSHQWI